jgi:hypothetical protein
MQVFLKTTNQQTTVPEQNGGFHYQLVVSSRSAIFEQLFYQLQRSFN